jgi:hypothetical protein
MDPVAGAISSLMQVLADLSARPEAAERALSSLTLMLIDTDGPASASLAALPLLVGQLPRAPTRNRTALISLLSRLALGEHPWPSPAAGGRYPAVRAALSVAGPGLLPELTVGDPRARHLLAHLLGWLDPSAEIDSALRESLHHEKYEAARASLLLALAVRGRRAQSSVDVDLLRNQLAPNTPLRVSAAAAVGFTFLDPAVPHPAVVRAALRAAADAAELGSTELAWNRGDLRALARQALGEAPQ